MTSLRRFVLVAPAMLALSTTSSFAQDGYRTPPPAITSILDSPNAPFASLSTDRKWLLISTSDVFETSIAELAEPTLYLAGRRFVTKPTSRIDFEGVRSASLKPVDGGAEITIPVPDGARLTAPQWNRTSTKLAYFVMTPTSMTLTVFDVATKQAKTIEGSTSNTRLASAGGWSRAGKHFLYTQTTPEGQALFVADIDAATARRLTSHSINFHQGGCTWTAGNAPALCLMFPAGRAVEEPKAPEAPTGPIVQESYGRAAPARTNTYLLQNRHDETLFDYYFTAQLASVALDGRITNLGAPAVMSMPSVSPDGRTIAFANTASPGR